MKRLIIGLVVVIGIIVTAVLSVNTVEVQSDLPPIKILPADYNPYQSLYDEMLYPTVRISSASGVGSGVIIHHRDTEDTKSIYILTASHVVGNNSSVTITFYTPLTHPPDVTSGDSVVTSLNRGDLTASVVITDTNKDLALLRLKPNTHPSGCHALAWVANLAPKDYQPFLFTPVWVVGCSLGLPPRPSSGHITSIKDERGEKKDERETFISSLSSLISPHWEISAPILPGNSGGGVFTTNTHELIGIAVWVRVYQGQLITTMAGVVPIQTIYEFLESYKQ